MTEEQVWQCDPELIFCANQTKGNILFAMGCIDRTFLSIARMGENRLELEPGSN